MAYLLGMDIGTSSTRAIIIDEDGRLIASATSDYPLITLKPGWAEQKPEDWWKASVEVIKKVIEKSKVKPEDIAAIGPSGQMHGSVFLGKDGNVFGLHSYGVTRGHKSSVMRFTRSLVTKVL